MRNIGGGCSLLLLGLHDFPFSQANLQGNSQITLLFSRLKLDQKPL